MPDRKAQERPSLGGWIAAIGFALAVVIAAIAALGALYDRADAQEKTTAAAPIPVETATLRRRAAYETTALFLGRVEPARTARLAFERAGLVEAVLLDEADAAATDAPLARLDIAPLEIERRRLAAARDALAADLALADATLARAETLQARGHETGQSLDEARFGAAALTARIAETDAAIARIDLDIAKSTLRAPFAGVLAERLLDEGAVVAAGAEIGLWQETGRPQARIGLPAARASQLAPGARFTLEGPDGPVGATLVSISPEIDPATRTVAALFDLDASAPLANSALIRLPLTRDEPGPGAWAPLSALQEGRKGLWSVYLLTDTTEGPVVRRADVEALHVAEGRAFIRGPFPDGARVVVTGLNRLTQGQRVTPVAAEAEPGA
jgi:RND family efflux transporter MFP subunit